MEYFFLKLYIFCWATFYDARHEKRRKRKDTVRGNLDRALNCSLIHFLKLKYWGTFTQNAQYVNSNAHLNLIKGLFSNKPSIRGYPEITLVAKGGGGHLKDNIG